MPSPPRALLDADVLFSFQIRNVILQLALREVISLAWTEAIEEEWLRNMELQNLERVRARTLPLLRKHFPDALIRDVNLHVSVGKTDAKDVHVAAAAVRVAPCRLVTWNLRHFDAAELAKHNVSVMNPDVFLCAVFDTNPELVVDITKSASAHLTKSAPTWEAYLEMLSKNRLTRFVERLRNFEIKKTEDMNLVTAVVEASDPPESGPTGTDHSKR